MDSMGSKKMSTGKRDQGHGSCIGWKQRFFCELFEHGNEEKKSEKQ